MIATRVYKRFIDESYGLVLNLQTGGMQTICRRRIEFIQEGLALFAISE